MTLDSIIQELQKSGANTKKLVHDALKNATRDDLIELRQSINEKICKPEEGKIKSYGQARPLWPDEKQYVI